MHVCNLYMGDHTKATWFFMHNSMIVSKKLGSCPHTSTQSHSRLHSPRPGLSLSVFFLRSIWRSSRGLQADTLHGGSPLRCLCVERGVRWLLVWLRSPPLLILLTTSHMATTVNDPPPTPASSYKTKLPGFSLTGRLRAGRNSKEEKSSDEQGTQEVSSDEAARSSQTIAELLSTEVRLQSRLGPGQAVPEQLRYKVAQWLLAASMQQRMSQNVYLKVLQTFDTFCSALTLFVTILA